MTDTHGDSDADNSNAGGADARSRHPNAAECAAGVVTSVASAWLAVTAVLAVAAAAWLGTRATIIKDELEATAQLIPVLKDDIAGDKPQEAKATSDTASLPRRRRPRGSGRSAVDLGRCRFRGSAPISAPSQKLPDQLTMSPALGVAPLVNVFDSLDWDSLLPSSAGTNLEPLQEASPSVSSAAHAVRASAERLDGIDASSLWPQVAEPLARAREQLQTVTGALDASANAAQIAPGMLGADGQRNYLLMIQNNAEARASGGIPGALAVLTLDNGKLTLGAQSSAGDVGIMSPVLPVDAEQQQIYSTRLGKYMQDVNLTPDFPTAAATAQAMWERKTGQHVDGVISMDPVALGYVLDATGPVQITDPELAAAAKGGLPTRADTARTLCRPCSPTSTRRSNALNCRTPILPALPRKSSEPFPAARVKPRA